MVTNFDNEALRAKYNPEGSRLRRDQMEKRRLSWKRTMSISIFKYLSLM